MKMKAAIEKSQWLLLVGQQFTLLVGDFKGCINYNIKEANKGGKL